MNPKHIVERFFNGREWAKIGVFNTKEEADAFFEQTLREHLDWPLRQLTMWRTHDGTSSSLALEGLRPLTTQEQTEVKEFGRIMEEEVIPAIIQDRKDRAALAVEARRQSPLSDFIMR